MGLFHNASGKIIGDANFTLLPGDIKPLPAGYEKHPTIRHYIDSGQLVPCGGSKASKPTPPTAPEGGSATPDGNAAGNATGAKGSSKKSGATGAKGSSTESVDTKTENQ